MNALRAALLLGALAPTFAAAEAVSGSASGAVANAGLAVYQDFSSTGGGKTDATLRTHPDAVAAPGYTGSNVQRYCKSGAAGNLWIGAVSGTVCPLDESADARADMDAMVYLAEAMDRVGMPEAEVHDTMRLAKKRLTQTRADFVATWPEMWIP